MKKINKSYVEKVTTNRSKIHFLQNKQWYASVIFKTLFLLDTQHLHNNTTLILRNIFDNF